VVVLVDDCDIVGDRACAVGRLISRDDPRFVHFDIDEEETRELEDCWKRKEPDIPLENLACPIRELADSAVALVSSIRHEQGLMSAVFGHVVPRWWQHPLHADEAAEAKAALRRDLGTVLVLVPYQL
jgi:hypothetical protein